MDMTETEVTKCAKFELSDVEVKELKDVSDLLYLMERRNDLSPFVTRRALINAQLILNALQ
ncbi:hypothetical protein [Pleionea sp. CnH1-48]|uniref:hypothetical protein n=1 Tax=Pleionea sp. CnH1-48 TaxID=2954494 RepID=UPI002096E923|nr:hypothetical protein [Pleionea sp. CnH1-48]MCO7225289.1 hypothetical protein [Pleionea sp. CnH1-48]